MSEDSPRPKKQDEGLPAYMGTFADLMSLLMCFFVLLLSFAEMDALKYKMVVKSLDNAFGVQREVIADAVPVGTSIIARDFSPGRPTPTVENQVRQQAVNEMRIYAEMAIDESERISKEELEADLQKVKRHLDIEIRDGFVEVDDDGERVITIRIKEMGSFPSGSAELNNDFKPVINKIAELVGDIGGHVVIAGHTDNLPISTSRFRSNWDLSSARAATVLERIAERSGQPAEHFRLAGHADTRPLDTNSTAEGRARNRRVEVILLRGGVHDSAVGPVYGGREA